MVLERACYCNRVNSEQSGGKSTTVESSPQSGVCLFLVGIRRWIHEPRKNHAFKAYVGHVGASSASFPLLDRVRKHGIVFCSIGSMRRQSFVSIRKETSLPSTMLSPGIRFPQVHLPHDKGKMITSW